jgi:hypothetical protein
MKGPTMNLKKTIARVKKDIKENYPAYVGIVAAAVTATAATTVYYRRSINELFEENYLIKKVDGNDDLVALVPLTSDCIQKMKDGETLAYPTDDGHFSMKLD